MSTTGPLDPAAPPTGTTTPASDTVVTAGNAGNAGTAGKSRTSKIVLAVIVAIALMAATTIALTVFGGSPADAQVTLQPLGSPGDDPFGPSIAPPPSATLADYAENGPRDDAGPTAQALDGATTSTLSDYRTVSGAVPGVFGGSLDERSCDVDQLVTFLLAEPEKAQAWALALGMDAGNIGPYADSLTAANLAADTRVLEHGFADGQLVPREAILQRGSAVLVDDRGVPRVDCYSGNPLRNPTIQENETYVGTPWPSFSEADVLVVEPAPAEIVEFVLVDVVDGDQFVRPAGSTGEADNPRPAADAPEETEPAAPQPTPTPAAVTRELNRVGLVDVNAPIRGEITSEDNELIYEFDAPPGAKLQLNVANDRASVGRVAIELQREGQTFEFFRVPQGGSESVALTLDHESGGRYEFIVTEGPGAFEFLIESQVQDDAGQGRDAGAEFGDALEVGSGDLVLGHLAGLDSSDAYLLELRDAPALVITARAARDGRRPAFGLEILGETLTFFRVNPADENTFELLLGPDDDGLLELYVTEGPSDYEFVVELVPQNDGGSGGDASGELADAVDVESADEIAGEVGERDTADYYLFTAPADDFTITVDISPRADRRVGVELMRPDGTTVEFFRVEPGASGSVTVSEPDTQGETYRLVLTEGRGDYTVSIDS